MPKCVKRDFNNNTPFTEAELGKMPILGRTVNKWRERNIDLLQHPTEPDMLISVGTTFDGGMVVVCSEYKTAWTTALDYASRGKVYVSD